MIRHLQEAFFWFSRKMKFSFCYSSDREKPQKSNLVATVFNYQIKSTKPLNPSVLYFISSLSVLNGNRIPEIVIPK